eukprot:UN04640
MFAQRLVKQAIEQRARHVVAQQTRKFGAGHGSALTGNATSPHYADFGYGPHQMLPSHEFMRYPVVAKPKQMPHYYKYLVPVTPSAGTQTMTNPTGLAIGLQTNFKDQFAALRNYNYKSRKRGLKIWSFFFFMGLFFEFGLMHKGFHYPQDKVWHDVSAMNLRLTAHGLQWDIVWQDFKFLPMEEVMRFLENRPYLRKNPYIITRVEEEIVARNKNEEGPLTKAVNQEKFEYAIETFKPQYDLVATWAVLTEDQKKELLPVYAVAQQQLNEGIAGLMEELKDVKNPEVEAQVEKHQAILSREKSDQYARSLKFIEAKLDL